MNLEITKMTSKGQVVIPQEIRMHNKIKTGEKFIVYDLDDSIVLKRIEGIENAKNVEDFEKSLRNMWEKARKRGITKKDVEDEIENHRKKIKVDSRY